MSEVKEPKWFHFMEGEQVPRDHPYHDYLVRTRVTTREAYEALFAGAGDAKAIGESSPGYYRDPLVPERVRRVLPEARVVAILRNPVDRAYASWLGGKRDGVAGPATFEAALRDEELGRGAARHQRFFAAGLYHRYLSRWFATFERERIRVYLNEDLRDDPAGLFRDLFGFLGVDRSFVPDTSTRRGQTGRLRNPVLRFAWEHADRPRRALGPLLPVRVRDRAYEWMIRDLVQPPMAEETRAALRERYRPEVLALQDLLGLDLSHWLSD
jgi:hypothetical protein